jgi:hypothetical protein
MNTFCTPNRVKRLLKESKHLLESIRIKRRSTRVMRFKPKDIIERLTEFPGLTKGNLYEVLSVTDCGSISILNDFGNPQVMPEGNFKLVTEAQEPMLRLKHHNEPGHIGLWWSPNKLKQKEAKGIMDLRVGDIIERVKKGSGVTVGKRYEVIKFKERNYPYIINDVGEEDWYSSGYFRKIPKEHEKEAQEPMLRLKHHNEPGSLVFHINDKPQVIVENPAFAAMYPGDTVRIGSDTYEVLRREYDIIKSELHVFL